MSGKARPLLSCPLVAVTGQGREGVESWERQRRRRMEEEGGKSSPVVHGRNSGFPNYFYPPVCE